MRSTEPRRIRILLVEDDESWAEFVRRLLSDVPEIACEWDRARSCAEAAEKLGAPGIDLCLMDYRLQDGVGLDLVKQAVALGSRFPIVFLTGEEDVNIAVEAVKAGATNYLFKRSLSRQILVDAIRKALPAQGGEGRETIVLIGALPAGTTLFEYRLDRVLGHGGFGITYLAWDSNLDKQVAIKEYLPDELAVRGLDSHVAVRTPGHQDAFQWGLQQFLKEAKALARFSHPNLIRVLRFFEANGTAYFVTEYVKGETLSDLIKRETMLPEYRLRAVLLPILDAVEQVHRVGVLHRDIKPANILLQMDGTPVLIDFGAARINVDDSKSRSIIAVYSIGYAPVEQYSADGRQGPWTDIYALAAVAYAALSGRRPVESLSRMQDDVLVPAVLAGRQRYSPAFLKAVDWGLSLRPEDRPRSVTEWRAAFGDAARLAVPAAAAPVVDGADSSRIKPPPWVEGDPESTLLLHLQRVGAAAAAMFPRLTPLRRYAIPAGVGIVLLLVAVTAALIIVGSRPAPQTVVTVEPSPPIATAPAPAQTAEPATSATDAAAAAKLASPARAKNKPKAGAESATESAAVAGNKKSPAKPLSKTAPMPVMQMTPRSAFQDCPNCPAMIVMPASTFSMGNRKEPGTRAWEGPVHSVTLRRFAIGRFEVTAGQWHECAVAGACARKNFSAAGATLAMVRVSWNEARSYATWLSKISGRLYRLPSESEWEFAARAGTRTQWSWGEDAQRQCLFANGADASARATLPPDTRVAGCRDGHASLAPVGSFPPNAMGLHDLAGNAWEWTSDCWRDSYDGAPQDGKPVNVAGCTTRVIRGGSWRTGPDSLRSGARWRRPQQDQTDSVGFRVVAE
ncbi:MAG TPA: SUMF1/EgtB/PvdO family nonheme iron enzyme [Verrucomicrobiae bacterium]|nr:SUMF1/EgtB/PvdO family nonheme iron enzyme [Verrucomicrobiae bacterium]